MDDAGAADHFLPGVPAAHVLARLRSAGGDEIGSGKIANAESSAALAVNSFGWFVDRPDLFPPLPGTDFTGPSDRVEVEYCARFPWSGGRHPWLDAAVFSATHLIGVESKRFEPFRDRKQVTLSEAYDRPVWGNNMSRYSLMRDALRSGSMHFVHLDAAQLVKHAYGLVTDARRLNKKPILFYIYAEPSHRAGRIITAEEKQRHRVEVDTFAAAVGGDEVQFHACSYRAWLVTWGDSPAVSAHREAIERRFAP